MKYIDLFNLSESLKGLSNLLLPARESIKISRYQRKIKPFVEEYLIEKDKIVIGCGNPQEDGTYKIPQENITEYNSKMKELNDIDVDIDFSDVEKIKLNGELNIQPSVLFYLQDHVVIV